MYVPVPMPTLFLEKKSISITRLKQVVGCGQVVVPALLKRKASRLRDWNVLRCRVGLSVHDHLKRKASRLRDWNRLSSPLGGRGGILLKRKASRLRDWNSVSLSLPIFAVRLEKKSISITRLKLVCCCWYLCICRLEKKSISITRLKPDFFHLFSSCMGILKRKASRLRDWNSVILAPRILPDERLKRKASRLRDWNVFVTMLSAVDSITWKEKHLDYEIET